MLELVKKCLWVVKKKKITKAAKNHSDYYIAYSATTNNSLDTKNLFFLKLVITRTEIFFDEFPHKVRLSMNSQPLNLGEKF